MTENDTRKKLVFLPKKAVNGNKLFVIPGACINDISVYIRLLIYSIKNRSDCIDAKLTIAYV